MPTFSLSTSWGCPTPTKDGLAQVKRIEMTFANPGAVTNAAFSFSITDTVPTGAPAPPSSVVERPAMFVSVDSVGDFVSSDFSSASAFQASPKIRTQISKDIDIVKLADGCPDISLYFLDGATWTTVKKPARDASLDTTQLCGYVLETDHWSKFAVGGVKIAVQALQSIIPSGGGGSAGGSASAGSAVGSGSGVSSSGSVGSSTISVSFDKVSQGGTVSASQVSPSQLGGIFSHVPSNTASLSISSGQQSTPYAIAGNVYDISTQGVNYSGPIQVSVPYNPSSLPASAEESDVRFLHYAAGKWEDATGSVDTEKNTVTGLVKSLSPVVAGFINDGTFKPDYFVKNPLQKVAIANATTAVLPGAGHERQVVTTVMIKNMQRANQTYAVVMQVVDARGFTDSVSWSTGTLERGMSATLSASATVDRSKYHVHVFVWDGIGENTMPLSDVSTHELQVHRGRGL